MKPNKVGQDFNRLEEKYPMKTSTQKYPRWIPVVFWMAVTAVITVVIFGFLQLEGGV